MDKFTFTEDSDWKPWCNAKPERERAPVVVPEDKIDKMVVCGKHNKVRGIFACIKTVAEDGAVAWTCKQADECFIQPKRGEGERLGNRSRYYISKQEQQERVCFACGGKSHDAAQCPLSRCPRCFESIESHKENNKLCPDRFLEGIPEWIRYESAAHLLCIRCGEKGHADCSRPKRPKNAYCSGCGNAGHYFDECNRRGQYLQTQRDKIALDAVSGGDNAIDIGIPISTGYDRGSGHKRPHGDSRHQHGWHGDSGHQHERHGDSRHQHGRHGDSRQHHGRHGGRQGFHNHHPKFPRV